MSIANMLTNLAEKLSNMLSGINTKLTAKGVSEAATLNDVAARIDEIPTGTDTTLDSSVAALASDIVSPKKAWVNGNLVAGTIADMGTQTATLNTSTTSYTIPAGKHSGSGKVSIVTQTKSATPSSSAQTIVPDNGKVLSSVSVSAIPTGTLSAPNISVSAGGVITATSGVSTAGYMSASASKSGTYAMLTQAGKTVTPNTYTQTAVSSGRYTTDTVYVAGDSNLVSENIKSGVSIFGVDGSFKALQFVARNCVVIHDSDGSVCIPVTVIDDTSKYLLWVHDLLHISLILTNTSSLSNKLLCCDAYVDSYDDYLSSGFQVTHSVYTNASGMVQYDTNRTGVGYAMELNGRNIYIGVTDAFGETMLREGDEYHVSITHTFDTTS